MKRLSKATKGVLAVSLAGLLVGCGMFRQRAAFKVLDDYLDAQVKYDLIRQRSHWDSASATLIAAGGTTIPSSPMQRWRMDSYSTSPDRITLKGAKAYASVAGRFEGPYNQAKNVTFTVFLSSHEETTREGKEEVWQVNEVETKRLLAEEVVGKGYGDLWVKQLEAFRGLYGGPGYGR